MEYYIAFFTLSTGIILLLPFFRHRWLITPLLISFFLRVAFALFHKFIWMFPQGSFDAIRFDKVALEWATQYGCTGVSSHFDTSASYVYSSFLAMYYSCLDYSALGAQFINVILGTLSVAVLALSSLNIWGVEAAKKTAYILAFLPFLLILSAVGLREAFILFFFSCGVFYITKYHISFSFFSFFLSILFIYLASLFHGGMFMATFGIGAGLILILLKNARLSMLSKFFVFSLLSLCFILFIYYFTQNVTLHKVGNISELDSSQIDVLLSNRADGQSAYLTGLKVNSVADMLWQLPIRMFYFLYSPFLWDIKSPSHIFGFIDGLIYLYFSFLVFRNRQVIFSKPVCVQLFLIVVTLAIVFSFGTSNSGTALRHRAKFFEIIIILAAPFVFRKVNYLSNDLNKE